jgi:hypothetical protein
MLIISVVDEFLVKQTKQSKTQFWAFKKALFLSGIQTHEFGFRFY